MLAAIGLIERYIAGISYETFEQQELLQDGVSYRLEIIGEACNGLSDEFKEKHPEIPWAGIVGMRNRIAHGYFDLNLRLIWDAATIDLPILKDHILKWRDELR